MRLALLQIVALLLLLKISLLARAASPSDSAPTDRNSAGDRTVIKLNDHEVLNPVTSSKAQLSGTLEIRFDGRIDPHENSVYCLLAPGVTTEGKYDRLILPEGWRGELSYHHNILAHHTSRNPRASGNAESGLLDYRNNVIYNWGFNSAYGGELWPRNWINNYYKYGPATSQNVRHRIFLQKIHSSPRSIPRKIDRRKTRNPNPELAQEFVWN